MAPMNRVEQIFDWAVVLTVGSAIAAAVAAGSWVVFDTFRAWMCGL